MGLTERLARACSGHPWRTLAVWIAVVLLSVGAAATSLHGLTTDAHVTNNPESERASKLIGQHFPFDKNKIVTDVLVIRSDTYTVDDREYAQFAALLLGAMRATHGLQAAHVWVKERDPSLISRDRSATRIPLFISSDDDAKDLARIVQDANDTPGFVVGITGNHTANNDFNTLSEDDLKAGELQFGLPAALIILVLVFGSLVGGLVPLVMAVLSIVVGIGLVTLLSQFFDLSVFIVNMLVGMGLALGVDYSLFVVSRYREERVNGRVQSDAIAMAGATASRAVLFSGTAFVVALFGMLLVPTTIMRSLAAGAILVGIVSVFAALTLLPALLGLLGDRVNALRIPFVSGGGAAESRFWTRIVRAVLRRPAISLALAAGAMILLALPVLGLHIGASGVSTLPERMPSKQGYELLQRYFPGDEVSPVRVVARDPEAPGVAGALERTATLLAVDPRFGRGQVQRSPDGALAVLNVPVRGDPKGKEAVAAVRDLRSRVLPRAFAGVGDQPLVGGETAENVDYFDAASKPAPYVLAFVLGLTLVLLTVVFRSVVVAATAIVLNLLSVGAAYGLLVLVFLHGWGTHLLGFEKVYAIDAWVPLFLFSVLFGLSMDYQVFLLSRIRERFDQTGDTTGAVEYGVASTARIITGAALIIVAVFTGFARGDLVMFQQMGFGVAIALLLDATVIRSVVLPSAMKLLGRWNWYLPRWLEWLPRVNVEGPAAERAQPASVS